MVGKYLGGGGVGDPLDDNPVGRLLIFRVVDLLGWVDRWLEVGEQATSLRLAVVDGDGVCVVWTKHRRQYIDQKDVYERPVLDHQSVQLGGLLNGGREARSEVLLLVFTSDGVLVTEDEVNLRGGVSIWSDTCKSSLEAHLGSRASEIRAEHDDPGGIIGELPGARLEAILKELEVATTTVPTLLVFDFVLNN